MVYLGVEEVCAVLGDADADLVRVVEAVAGDVVALVEHQDLLVEQLRSETKFAMSD